MKVFYEHRLLSKSRKNGKNSSNRKNIDANAEIIHEK